MKIFNLKIESRFFSKRVALVDFFFELSSHLDNHCETKFTMKYFVVARARAAVLMLALCLLNISILIFFIIFLLCIFIRRMIKKKNQKYKNFEILDKVLRMSL